MTCVRNAISLRTEMMSYETLWGWPQQSLKSLAEMFAEHQVVPSQLLQLKESEDLFGWGELRESVAAHLAPLRGFSVCVNGTFQYPMSIRAARHPVELFYYRGDIAILESKCVSVVGARKASDHKVAQAAAIAAGLVAKDYTIVSGLAAGIDTAAMTSALRAGGRTIGVIGTPINEAYPKTNSELQEHVAGRHLLISQVPFYRYSREPFPSKKRYFPERNETMAALSAATIIVEASDKSGSLTQARACMHQGRKLMIMNSCFENRDISWPAYYEKKGAVRVKDVDDILSVLDG